MLLHKDDARNDGQRKLTGRLVLGAVLSFAVWIDQSAHTVVWVAVASRCQAALPQQHQTAGVTATSGMP